MDPVVIVAARRTPIGALNGQFASLSAPRLASTAIAAVVADAGLPADAYDEALVGCVLPAGLGQAPARQAVLGAGLPGSVACTMVNKVCGSGMKALMLGHDLVLAGTARTVLAAGMESMTNAPYLLPGARQGYRYGHVRTLDHMAFDGLENAYDGQPMGVFGELCAERYGFGREMQDAFALESVRRARMALTEGCFAAEIAPVTVTDPGGEKRVAMDETPGRCRPEKITSLRPAFKVDGSITAASASSISDGAAALVVTRESVARGAGAPLLARIMGHATHAHDPAWFTTAPVGAIRKLLDRLGWLATDVDLYEINEAFAVVALAAIHDLGLDPGRVNVHGGACALGHPIGASGARIVVTLVHALHRYGLRRGVAALCIGGGEATAVAIERM
ncbi:MAG: acetyl-CoA C-acyltransferase [Proteobacteria bacterium]|nr:acetyl-CoA C-acyltransferase [Pseudomonadota bacterium]HQR03079.1 acetyl-CoA C-acyltransferase [Rhodocyclaceae bacterium]